MPKLKNGPQNDSPRAVLEQNLKKTKNYFFAKYQHHKKKNSD